jgi:RNA polymerase sigma-70 factor (ECF subfamily)
MGDFATDTEPYRRELLAHCYRMLGSVDDAEDVVQETYMRAWRSYEAFQGRSSVRTWLHQIATNACLSALSHSSRRFLPSGLGGPADDPMAPPTAAEAPWVQPIPDSLLDPAAIVAARDSLRIALIATLQKLPGRQRAVFVLRDVLEWPASDVASLERLLSRDATLEATPWRSWYAGRATCVPYLSRWVLGAPGDWSMRPTAANGQPAALAYVHGQPYGVVVLTVIGDRIGRIVSFQDPALVARFTGPSGGLAG